MTQRPTKPVSEAVPKRGASRGAGSPPPSETTIVIGGRTTWILFALLAVALMGGIAYRFSRSSGGARLRAQIMRWDIPTPAPLALAEMEPDVREAIETAEQAVLADRGSAPAWRHLGMVYDAHSLWALALPCYERALQLAPTDGQSAYYVAMATELGERPIEEIVAAYERAIALAPTYGPARLRLGDALLRVGRNLEARDVLIQAVNVYQGEATARARRSLGLALLALDDPKGAAESLEAAARIRGDDAVTFKALGQAYNQLGRGPDARQAIERAAKLQETMAYYDDWRVAVLELAVSPTLVQLRISQKAQLGEFDEALADAKRWEARHPDWPSIKILIGNLQRQAGHPELAQPYFDAATALTKAGKSQ